MTARGRATRRVVHVDGRPVSVEIRSDGGFATEGEAPALQVAPLGGGAYRVTREDNVTLLFVAGSGDRRWVFVEGETHEVDLADRSRSDPLPRARRRGALSAPMPATVVKVFVGPGDVVRAGETLLIVEAMKMELPLTAPHGGRVAAMHCAEGDRVEPGVELVELTEEPAEEGHDGGEPSR